MDQFLIVAHRTLAKFHNNIYNYKELGRPLYRSKEDRSKVLKPDKSNWYRKTGATATFTVPYTTNSELANRIRESIKDTGLVGTRVLVSEKPGQKLMATLGPNNPSPREFCHRESCLLKSTKCLESCSKEGVVYKIWCQRCHTDQLDRGVAEPKDSVYIGETSRTVFTRFHQPFRDYIKAS